MGSSFSGFVCLVFVCFLCINVFPNLGEVFFYDIIEDLVYGIDLAFFSFIYAYNLNSWSFNGIPKFFHVCLFVFVCVP